MPYTKLFDPTGREDLRTDEERAHSTAGDRRDGKIYVYDAAGEIVLAVNIALATGRPLLLSGPSGSGKSSLAQHVARVLGRRYYEYVVTARTQAQDLTWRFDAVRRLADAQVPNLLPKGRSLENIYPYIEPQALWWIFDRESARLRGRADTQAEAATADARPEEAEADSNTSVQAPKDPVKWDPRQAIARGKLPPEPQFDSCVLLVDEIDKADPDVPNNLLVELGSMQFDVDLLGRTIRFQGRRDDWTARPLVIITTNKERPLPQPFVRRCIVLEVPKPTRGLLKSIAAHNFPAYDNPFFDSVLDAVLAGRSGSVSGNANGSDPSQVMLRDGEAVEVSIAEYIDTLRACTQLAERAQAEAAESAEPLNQTLLDEIVKRTVWIAKERTLRSQ
jgi:MoxR-like ATPase